MTVQSDHDRRKTPEIQPEDPGIRRVDQPQADAFSGSHRDAFRHLAVDGHGIADTTAVHRVVTASEVRRQSVRLGSCASHRASRSGRDPHGSGPPPRRSAARKGRGRPVPNCAGAGDTRMYLRPAHRIRRETCHRPGSGPVSGKARRPSHWVCECHASGPSSLHLARSRARTRIRSPCRTRISGPGRDPL